MNRSTALWLLALGCPALPALAQPASAPDCTPVSPLTLVSPQILGNGSPGSISTAQLQAALDSGGEILLDQGAAPSTIVLASALIISRAVIVDGAGRITLSGANARRLFELRNPSGSTYTATLQGLQLVEGDASTAGGDEFARSGGAILNDHGGEPWQALSLQLINMTISDSRAIQTAQDGGGGALYLIGHRELLISNSRFENNSGANGGAIYTLGTQRVKIVDSVFSGNQATGSGGNPGNGGNAGAIGIDGAERLVTLCRNDIIDNRANAFGIGFFSVMYDLLSFTNIEDSTFSGNLNAGNSGFATVYLQGGPLRVAGTTIANNEANAFTGIYFGPNASGELVNATIAGNLARSGLGGGIAADTSASIRIQNTTIAGNHSGAFAGGIAVGTPNLLHVSNTLLVNNTGGNAFVSWNTNNAANAGSNNLQWPLTRPNNGAEVAIRPGTVFQAPMIGALGDQGGPTDTIPLLTNSPAVDAGAAAGAPPLDQRGVPRQPPPDIGAFELAEDPARIFASGFEG